MTVQRYDTPNHPRWYPQTNDAPTEATKSRRRYGRATRGRDDRRANGSRRDDRRTEGTPRSEPSPLLSREATGDDATVELRNTSERVWITTELPDCSLDDVHVSVGGASIRIRAEPSAEASKPNGIDRTITLAETVDAADVVVAYDDPTLTVVVPVGGR